MFVTINGGGEVGSFLSRALHAKGHAVSLIDARSEVLRRLADELSTDVLLVEGEGCDVRALEEAGVDRADVFASVTPRDEDNLVACRLAREAFGVRRVVARVNSPRNEATFHALGIEAISSTTVIGRLIEEHLSVGDIVRLSTLRCGNAALVEVEVLDAPGSAAGRTVADLRLPEGIVLVAIQRGDDVVIPRGPSALRAGDRVMAVVIAGREEQLARALRGNGTSAGRRDRAEAAS